MTRFWLLAPHDERPKDRWGHEDHWGYGSIYGFVIEATDESQARQVAQEHREYEGSTHTVWLDPAYTTCVPVGTTGTGRVVLRDYLDG